MKKLSSFRKAKKKEEPRTSFGVSVLPSVVSMMDANPIYRDDAGDGKVRMEAEGNVVYTPLWSRAFDDVSGNYYWVNEKSGETKWEDDSLPGSDGSSQQEADHVFGSNMYHEFFTEDGEVFYVQADDPNAESVWDLPHGAIVVDGGS